MNLLVIVIAVIVLCFLMGWGVRKSHKPEPELRTFNTIYGTFTQRTYGKKSCWWETHLVEAGDLVTLCVQDKEGVPDQDSLNRIPGLARLVRESDAVARSAMKEYLRDYDPPNPTLELAEVSIDTNPNSFELHYATEADEGYDFSIFVTFTDGRVVDVLLVD